MKLRFIFSVFSLLFLSGVLRSQQIQRVDRTEAAAWAGYITSYRLNADYSIWNDWHFVPGSFFISRHGLTRHLTDQISVSGGYAWLYLTVPSAGSRELKRFEHRPWSQLMMVLPLGKKYRLNHRIRYDARFRQNASGGALESGYGLTHRVRFMTAIRRPLAARQLGHDKLFIILGNEVLLNFGPNVIVNSLDQNRTYLMLGYQFDNLVIQGGYLYRFIPGTTAGSFNHQHTATVWISHVFGAENAKKERFEELLYRDP